MKKLIDAVIYTDIHDELGPNPIHWLPSNLPEAIKMLVGIKTVTILSGDQGSVPDSLLIIPFPSLKLKGLIRYIEREDESKRGGFARSAITFLFKETDDVIFYKYMSYLKAPFDETTRNIIDMETRNVDSREIFEEIKILRDSISKLLDDFRTKEITSPTSKEFPEKRIKEKKIVDFRFKLVIVGDPGVGKTSTILRFTDNAFLRTYIPTLGVSINEKIFDAKMGVIEMVLWDIAGQAKFQTMRRHFYQGSEAILLIFDLTNRISFTSIKNWYHDVMKNMEKHHHQMVGYIFGNKSDLTEVRKIKLAEALVLAKELNLKYIETSALTGSNVEYAFYDIAETVIKMRLNKA
ncbi:MAG: GTP-binding protein [Candidatus Lokiarchaeota archaeon]|nr:GTP-binding protein [Candidatus Lokiarchaeota archaeon]